MRIEIDTIPRKKQRYNTCGDYYFDEDEVLQIKVSDMGNCDYEFLVSVHELIESYLCLKDEIDYDKITKFDEYFEKMRKDYPDLIGDMEPGDHEEAPYHKQHKIASMMEKWLADNMKIDFEAYNKRINEL